MQTHNINNIRAYWKYTQVLFSKLICSATIKSSRIVRHSDTNNIQSSHHCQADIRSQRLERLHQSLRSSAYWRSHSMGKTLRLLWLWFTTVWWTVRQCWRTTIWQCTKKLSPYLTSSPPHGIASLTEL